MFQFEQSASAQYSSAMVVKDDDDDSDDFDEDYDELDTHILKASFSDSSTKKQAVEPQLMLKKSSKKVQVCECNGPRVSAFNSPGILKLIEESKTTK